MTNLSEPIALLELWTDDESVGCGPVRSDVLGSKIRPYLAALLSAARRVVAIERVGGDLERLRTLVDSGMSIIAPSTILDLIDLASDREAQAAEVERLLKQRADERRAHSDARSRAEQAEARVRELENLLP